ncbi:hypothetical protein QYM36_006245, partial [Artemia franciscana]
MMWIEKKELSVHEIVSDNLSEGVTKTLDNALESKDLVGVQVAKAMLDPLKAQ